MRMPVFRVAEKKTNHGCQQQRNIVIFLRVFLRFFTEKNARIIHVAPAMHVFSVVLYPPDSACGYADVGISGRREKGQSRVISAKKQKVAFS